MTMPEKPTYEELEQRIKELEQEKLENKIIPENQIPEVDLAAVINAEEIQSIMDDFCYLTNMVTAILDLKGNVIETTGWQDICTKFHRIHPGTAQNCTQSDLYLAKNLKPGEYVDYKCKNGLWDVVTPLYIGTQHLGNIYTGQFFYEDEQIDEEFFVRQAMTYGFDKDAYMDAFRRIPRYSRETVNRLMCFLVKFTTYISRISFVNIQLKKEIRERKRAEKVRQESESFIKAVMDNLPIGIAVNSRDPAVEFEYMNDNFPRFYRTTREALSGPGAFWTSIYEDPDFREKMRKKILDDLDSGDPERLYWENVPISRKGEKTSYITAHNMPVPDRHIWISTVWDVTDRKNAEEKIYELNRNLELRVQERTMQLEKVNKELEDFVYSVSHDLRAPLRSISGFAQIIDRRYKASLNTEGQHYFDNIVKASRQMGDLIDDLLKFSRLGNRAIKSEAVSLEEVLKTAEKTLSDQIKETGARVTLPKKMPNIQGDLTLATHVFINLFENALKYRKADEPPVIDVRFDIEDQYVIISVTDNGIGIEPAHHEKIFNIFHRLYSQAEYSGTGIGLAAVKKAVEIMDGRVWVESEPEKGSVFRVKVLKATTLITGV
jgi:PAS domain S-box-containing protein